MSASTEVRQNAFAKATAVLPWTNTQLNVSLRPVYFLDRLTMFPFAYFDFLPNKFVGACSLPYFLSFSFYLGNTTLYLCMCRHILTCFLLLPMLRARVATKYRPEGRQVLLGISYRDAKLGKYQLTLKAGCLLQD